MFPILFILFVITVIVVGFIYIFTPSATGTSSPENSRSPLQSDNYDEPLSTSSGQDIFDIDANAYPMVDQSGLSFAIDPFTSNMVDTTFTGGQALDSFPESDSFDHDDKYD